MAEQVESKPVGASGSNDKVMAAVATIPLVGLIIFLAMKDASPVVKHYAKQSNAILALEVISMIVTVVGSMIIIGACVGFVIGIVAFVGWVLLLLKALKLDEKYVLPVVGEYFDKLMK
jgi:uncharacterized membrane protein